MRKDEKIRKEYFEWMYDLVCDGRFAEAITYRRLFELLHRTEFVYFVPHDENRADDGISLRYHYCVSHECEDLEQYLDGPCSILEMMVALAIREEHIMSDPDRGDRTAQWFWTMISSLGLSGMTDYNFDKEFVNDSIAKFLNREYSPDGKGGLFTVRKWKRDARTAEIWHQLLAYLNTLG
jgi:hypothetical protein